MKTYIKNILFFYRWHYECREQWSTASHSQMYTIFIFSFTFGVPLLGLAYTYSAIAWRMWRRASPGNPDPDRDLVQLRAKKKVVRLSIYQF